MLKKLIPILTIHILINNKKKNELTVTHIFQGFGEERKKFYFFSLSVVVECKSTQDSNFIVYFRFIFLYIVLRALKLLFFLGEKKRAENILMIKKDTFHFFKYL